MAERPRVAVVGSGRAGLACAAALAGRAAVTIFERLPVLGGEEWEQPPVRDLVAQVEASGAQAAAGTQVIRWEGDRVVGVGHPGGIVPADALVIATGHRPLSRAELRIDGPRCAGVLPATVALHLLDHGVTLGRQVVVLGSGEWADAVVQRVVGRGARCTVVGRPVAGALAAPGDRVVRTVGPVRIDAIDVAEGERVERLPCDALVLAAGRVPYRNVDGAVDVAPRVTFAQAPSGSAEAVGRAAAEEALVRADGSREHVPITLRTAGPR